MKLSNGDRELLKKFLDATYPKWAHAITGADIPSQQSKSQPDLVKSRGIALFCHSLGRKEEMCATDLGISRGSFRRLVTRVAGRIRAEKRKTRFRETGTDDRAARAIDEPLRAAWLRILGDDATGPVRAPRRDAILRLLSDRAGEWETYSARALCEWITREKPGIKVSIPRVYAALYHLGVRRAVKNVGGAKVSLWGSPLAGLFIFEPQPVWLWKGDPAYDSARIVGAPTKPHEPITASPEEVPPRRNPRRGGTQ